MAQEPGSTIVKPDRDLAISDGRKFQQTNDTYMLPTDGGEHSRLDMQHEIVRPMLGGELYQTPELVKATLSSQERIKRRILDIGAGSGKWAIEMAEEFPHAEVLGIDLVEPNILSDAARQVPPNCSFQIADANRDMGTIDPGYDLVYFRCVEAGIDDSDLLFYDAARVLRPGGLLLLLGADIQLVDENGKYLPLQKPGDVRYSHFQHLVSCLKEAHMKFGPLRLRYPFWKSILESNPNFSDVQVQELLVPSGPWSSNLSENERKLAEGMQANILHLLPAFKAGLLHGKSVPQEFVNNLAEVRSFSQSSGPFSHGNTNLGCDKEVQEQLAAVHGYIKWVFATTMRNDMPWAARQKPWQEPPGYDIYDYVVRPLPKG